MHNRPFDQLFNERQGLGDERTPFEFPLYGNRQDVSIINGTTSHNHLEAKSGPMHSEAKLASYGPTHLPELLLVESQSTQGEANFAPPKLSDNNILETVPRQLFESDCQLTHTILPDGTMKTEQAALDGTMRTHLRHTDGTAQEKIADRYGRPLYVRDINPEGHWTVSQMQYLDCAGRVSPFLATKRISTSDGKVQELNYGKPNKIAKRA